MSCGSVMLLLLGRSYPSWEAVGPPAKVWAFATGLSHVGLRAGYWWASLLVSNTASPAWRFGATPDTGRGKDELAIGATGSFVGRGEGGERRWRSAGISAPLAPSESAWMPSTDREHGFTSW